VLFFWPTVTLCDLSVVACNASIIYCG